jgi:hypothetical protein
MSEPVSTPDVSILIVAYNSRAVIADCLASISPAITRHTCEILLIDNGDGTTADLIARAFPHVRIIPSRGNVGFAAGNNLLAAEAQGRYLLLLNPDVVLKPEAIDRLVDASNRYPGAAAWGGVTLDRNDRPDLGNTVHIPSLSELASRVLGRSSAATAPLLGVENDAKVEVLSGSFVMIARGAWDEVEGLDDSYFLYCEEVDLFFRMAKEGYKFWRIGSARGYHDIGHGVVFSSPRMLYRAAGTMQFARLHWTRIHQFIAFLLIWLGAWQRFIVGRLVGHRSPRLGQVGESHRDIVLRPHFWAYGYDAERGLLARLEGERRL